MLRYYILIGIFLFPILHYAQSTNQVELVIEKAYFEKNLYYPKNYFVFHVYFKNNSSEKIVIDKLKASNSKYKIADIPESDFYYIVGTVEKPYHIILTKEGVCPVSKDPYLPEFKGDTIYRHTFHNLEILPGQQSKSEYVSIKMDGSYFCEEAKYTLQLVYEPNNKTLTSEQKAKLKELDNRYNALIKAHEDYNKKEGIPMSKTPKLRSQHTSRMNVLLDGSDPSIRKLSLIKVESNIIEVVKKQ